MSRPDIASLYQDVCNSREVVVEVDGTVRSEDSAREQDRADRERGVEPQPRTRLKPNAWGAALPPKRVPIVWVSLSALQGMHREAAAHPGESGGILVGPDPRTVTEFIPSGRDAARTATRYELDIEHLQPLLAAAEDRGLRFVGVFHTHPAGCASLSALDLETASAILADPDSHTSSLILPLAVRHGSGFETSFYFLSRGDRTPVVAELRLMFESDAAEGRAVASSRGSDVACEGQRTAPAAATPAPTCVRPKQGLVRGAL